MARLREPPSLQTLCRRSLSRQLAALCRRLQETLTLPAAVAEARRLRPWLCSELAGPVRARLLSDTVQLLAEPLLAVALLLGPDVARLRAHLCCYYGCRGQTELLRLLAERGGGLRELELTRPSLLRLDLCRLSTALSQMPRLVELRLCKVACDGLLQAVAESCPLLQLLDVRGSRLVTDHGVRALLLLAATITDSDAGGSKTGRVETKPRTGRGRGLLAWLRGKRKSAILDGRRSSGGGSNGDWPGLLVLTEQPSALCGSLRQLLMANTGVTAAGALLALKYLPELRSLGDLPLPLARGPRPLPQQLLGKPLALTEATLIRPTIMHMAAIAEACPHLQKLLLIQPRITQPTTAYFTQLLLKIPLSYLQIRFFYNGAVTDFCSFGDYVTDGRHSPPANEHLIHDTIILAAALRGLPQLRKLSIHFPWDPEPPVVDLFFVTSSCPLLKVLHIEGASIHCMAQKDCNKSTVGLIAAQLGSEMSADAVYKLMAHAPNLESLHIHRCPDLTFDPLPPAPALRCLYLHEAPKVPFQAVHKLIQSWDHLIRLGTMAAFKFTPSQIETLTVAAQCANIDIVSVQHSSEEDCLFRDEVTQ